MNANKEQVRAEAPRERENEEDVWVEELSKIEEEESSFLPQRTIVSAPAKQ